MERSNSKAENKRGKTSNVTVKPASKTPKSVKKVQKPKDFEPVPGSKSEGFNWKHAVLFIILAAVAVSVLVTAYIYENENSASNVPLSAFLGNLRAAPTMGIFVTNLNGTVYSDANYCATSLIYQIISQNYTHRDPATIDYFVLTPNTSTCTYTQGLRSASNLTNTSISDCMNISTTMPSIFINYSTVNRTIIRNNAMYIEGSPEYLYECGISAQVN